MKNLVLSIMMLVGSAMAAPAPVKINEGLSSVRVFKAGEDGHPHYRIPSVVTSKSGTVLVFAEGRHHKTDHGYNDIVVKRSTDNGKSWGKTINIHLDENFTMVNPSPVALPNGDIIVFYEAYPKGRHSRNGSERGISFKMMDAGYKKGATQRLLMRVSKDDGKSWSQARDLTKIARPYDKKKGSKVGYISSGSPANGIVLKKGKFKGRIIMPLFLAKRLDGEKRTWNNAVLYSDDMGKSWKLSHYVPVKSTQNCNECTVAELDDGSVMMNARPTKDKMRAVAISKDGGLTWSPFKYDKALFGRTCNIGFLRYSYSDDDKSRLVFVNNANNSRSRKNGTVRISYDEGKTWPASTVLVPGLFGYSQMTRLDDGYIGLIFEPFTSVREVWDLHFIRIPLKVLEK